MERFRLMLVIAAALGGMAAPGAQAAPLRLCFEDVPQAPWTMPDGSGLNIELLKRVEKLTGDKFRFVSQPWKRCLEETRGGQMDGMIGAADSPQRRLFSLPPTLAGGAEDPARALYEDRVYMFIRVGSGASWDGKNLVNPSGSVVAQRGYFVVDLLRARGQQVHESIKSSEEGLRMLSAQSADVAVLLGRSASNMVRDDPRFRGRIVRTEQPFVNIPFHVLFGKKAYAADPKRIEAVWNAMAKVRASPGYRKLEAEALRPDAQ